MILGAGIWYVRLRVPSQHHPETFFGANHEARGTANDGSELRAMWPELGAMSNMEVVKYIY